MLAAARALVLPVPYTFWSRSKLEKEEEVKKKGKRNNSLCWGTGEKKIEGGGRYGIRARVEEGILPSNNFVFIFIFIFFFRFILFLFFRHLVYSFRRFRKRKKKRERKKEKKKNMR